MTKRIIAACVVLGFAIPAAADDRLVGFDGGVGVIPTGSGNTTTRGVPAAGQIWVISRLSAEVRTDARISVEGRGLLLAAGNNVGTNGGQSVRARLFCGAAGAEVAFDSATVPLEPNGDFRIDGEVANANAALPPTCERPVLLILNGAGTAWFAAAFPKL
jgi:hypothetical protein